MGNIY